MRSRLKQIGSHVLIPLIRWYLRKERKYQYKGTRVFVQPGVFHPGLFHSTKFLIDYLGEHSLANQSFLELGCGTGLVSIIAAKHGAQVYASDLSMSAVKNVTRNASLNGVFITPIHSDLFDNIDRRVFDWIVINPPYYPRAPMNESELAWFCGQNFEYYQRLFASIKDYMHAATKVIMATTLGSELEKIISIGKDQQLEFELVKEKKVFFDGKDFLYRIKRAP
jgi:release factor glutamine methyltransferase